MGFSSVRVVKHSFTIQALLNVASTAPFVRMVQAQLPDLESNESATAAIANDRPVFQIMFGGGIFSKEKPVSETVCQLWGRRDVNDAAEPPRNFPSNASDTQPACVEGRGRQVGVIAGLRVAILNLF